MTTVNYMHVLPGGHCFICHKDYPEMHKDHPCFKVPLRKGTPCTKDCASSKYKVKGFTYPYPNRPTT